MRYRSIKTHLQPYSIAARRTTTINHAFAAAIAPNDDVKTLSEETITIATEMLGQKIDAELNCVYCGELAETWDHLFPTVIASRFSGYGHRLGNLVPCCKICNSKKGNKPWRAFLEHRVSDESLRLERAKQIAAFIEKFSVKDEVPYESIDFTRYERLRLQVIQLCKEADELAKKIRNADLLRLKHGHTSRGD